MKSIDLDELSRKERLDTIELTDEIWDIVEKNILCTMGLNTVSFISIIISNTETYVTIYDSNNSMVSSKELETSFNSEILKTTDLVFEINLKINNKDAFLINDESCTFCFVDEKSFSEDLDDGIIYCSYDVNCSIKDINLLKERFQRELTRELQSSIQRNIWHISPLKEDENYYEINYKKIKVEYLLVDSLYEEVLYLISKKNLNYSDSINILIKDYFLDKNISNYLIDYCKFHERNNEKDI